MPAAVVPAVSVAVVVVIAPVMAMVPMAPMMHHLLGEAIPSRGRFSRDGDRRGLDGTRGYDEAEPRAGDRDGHDLRNDRSDAKTH